MSGIYIFSLVVGLPLLLWMVFAGDAEGGEGFGADLDGDGPLGAIPLSAVAFFLTAFGGIGLLGEVTDTGFFVTLVVALLVGAGVGIGSRAAFRWLGKDSASSEVADAELEGLIARVSLPVSTAHRGRIIVDVAGAREQMTASPVDGSTIERGEEVVIVRIQQGVALVAPLGTNLELE